MSKTMENPMSHRARTRPSISISMESSTGTPTSPSAFLPGPRSANSWTARSFTTLQPSDSPSQAQFPKHSQTSLLLETRARQARIAPQPKQQPIVKEDNQQAFFVRNVCFIALAVFFHASVIVVTTLLVMVITAAMSTPPKHIRPGYYIGVILSFASGLASIIIGYVRWNERKTNPVTGEATPPDVNIHNQAELGLAPFTIPSQSPVDELRAVVSNWEQSTPAAGHQFRTLMTTRNPLPSASARLAGSNNRPCITDQGIELQSLHPYAPRHLDSCATALELQRFLDYELERQKLIKRRISTWLRGVSSAQSTLVQSTIPNPPLPRDAPSSPRYDNPHRPRQQRGGDPAITRIPANPARLAEIDAEIQAYLGHPAPPLAISAEHAAGLGIGIDYAALPPAIPRPGAKGRDPVRSDPTTVVYVGPDPRRRCEGCGCRGGGCAGSGSEGGGEAVEGGREEGGKAKGKERDEGDDFAERWMERVMRGVEVETSVEGVVGGEGKGEEVEVEVERKGWWRRGG